jgi:predicted DNA-binding protein
MQGGKTITITVRVSPEMRERLKALAGKEHRTLSQYAMLVLQRHLEEQQPAKK